MSKTADRGLRDAALGFFEAKDWNDPYAVTLTLKQTRRDNDCWVPRRDGDAEQNLRHFLNVLRKRLVRYGFSKKADLRCVPVLEGDENTRPHFHLIIDKPDCVTMEQFAVLIVHEWSCTRWGHTRVDIKRVHDTKGWLNYIFKLRTKADYAASIDWTNVRLFTPTRV